ncbi:MAG: aminotransferase class V-fold PLP-dependent enzyme, partial [Aquihabitans sp.]
MNAPMPEPPDGSFASDNAAGVCPEVMEALAAANRGPALAYGDDPWTEAATHAIQNVVEAPVEVLFCWGGTGANVVGLATVLQPWQAVICTDTAHIVVDECGAPARFTGSTITPVPHVDGKLTPAGMEPFLAWLGTEHHPQPKVLSISQVTEMGTVYNADEIGALTERAHANEMVVHLDGARIANAVAAGESTLAAMVRDTGVDVMTFGFTKNGAMFGEAVVYLQPELGAH